MVSLGNVVSKGRVQKPPLQELLLIPPRKLHPPRKFEANTYKSIRRIMGES
jgi:hypothetical protein